MQEIADELLAETEVCTSGVRVRAITRVQQGYGQGTMQVYTIIVPALSPSEEQGNAMPAQVQHRCSLTPTIAEVQLLYLLLLQRCCTHSTPLSQPVTKRLTLTLTLPPTLTLSDEGQQRGTADDRQGLLVKSGSEP